MKTENTSVALAIVGVALAAVIGAVVIDMSGGDSTRLLTSMLTLIPILAIQVYHSKQINALQQTSGDIKESINGRLHGKLDGIMTAIQGKHAPNETGSEPLP